MILRTLYNEAINNKNILSGSNNRLQNYTIEAIFTQNNQKKFFKDLLYDKNEKIELIDNIIENMSEFRLNHTICSFLLGILLVEKFKFNFKTWPRLLNDKSSNKSFYIIWGLACLFHDCCYKYEEKGEIRNYPLEKYSTVLDFIYEEKIIYSLLENMYESDIDYKSLIENYYIYRIKNFQCIDHGISSGLVVFEMFYNLNLMKNEKIIYGMKLSDDFLNKISAICTTISRHNMYFVDENSVEANFYKTSGLEKLIINKDLKISYKNDVLLYLLGIVDTIEFYKSFNRNANDTTDYSFMDYVDIEFENNSMSIISQKYYEYIIKFKDSLTNWLKIDVNDIDNGIKVEILKN